MAMFLSAQGKHEEARAQLTSSVIRNAEVDPDIAYSVASVYALEGMRYLILTGWSVESLAKALGSVTAFAIITVTMTLAARRWRTA